MKLTAAMIARCAEWVRENGLIEYGGATIRDFCKGVGIAERTWGNWKNNAEFAEAIKKAKEDFASNLEKDIVLSLARSAKGYSYVRKKTEYRRGADGEPKVSKQTSEEINMPPNIGAAIFLLTNLNGDRWKNKQSNENDTKITGFEQLMMELDKKDGGE